MKLSIIIPAYNAEKYIETCLNSISSDNQNLEVLVINDGSTDNTSEIVKKYSNVSLYNNNNNGVSYSRNYGIKKATGDYIMFVDSDDYLKKEWIDIILTLNSDSDVIYITKNMDYSITKEELLCHISGIKKPCIAGPYCKLFKNNFIKIGRASCRERV